MYMHYNELHIFRTANQTAFSGEISRVMCTLLPIVRHVMLLQSCAAFTLLIISFGSRQIVPSACPGISSSQSLRIEYLWALFTH